MNFFNKQTDTKKSQMQVLNLQDLDVIEAGMAVAQWNMLDLDPELTAWDTLSAEA